MKMIAAALRRPVTILIGVIALALACLLPLGPSIAQMLGVRYPAFLPKGMEVDIFPSLNLPVIYVCQPYGGMDPAQMEGYLTNYYEYHFLYISGIKQVESKNVQGVALMKLEFHPGTNMAQAMAETINYVNRSQAFMPPGTVSPFVMRFDTGSVPVGMLVLSSETKSIGEIQDQALFRVRPMFAALPGVSAPPPFGGAQRTVVVTARPDRLRAYNLSPDEVVQALVEGNRLTPSGNIPLGDRYPIVPVNSIVKDIRDLERIPIRSGAGGPVYLGDIGDVTDTSDAPTGYALADGRRAVYILVNKRAEASTLSVVNHVRQAIPDMQDVLPDDISVRFEFDQSPYVTRAATGVVLTGLLGAVLVGLMILIFLRDWRSALIVVINIPLALMAAVLALWLTGNTINLMTLGGLALAIGILVDEATVVIENIHAHLQRGQPLALAVRDGAAETTTPRFMAMLCILAVFISSFFMQGAAQALFVPMSLAVGFAEIASFLLATVFAPILAVWFLRHTARAGDSRRVGEGETERQRDGETERQSHRGPGDGSVSAADARPRSRTVLDRLSGFWRRLLPVSSSSSRPFAPSASGTAFDRVRVRYEGLLGGVVRWRFAVIVAYLAVSAAIIGGIGPQLGQEIFPMADTGQFRLRLRAPDGTHIAASEKVAIDVLDAIGEEAGPENIDLTLGYVGAIPSSYPINAVYQWSRGPEEAILRVALKPGCGIRVEHFKEQLRGSLAERFPDVRFSFEPADIINEVMSFGSPTPIEIAVSGPNFDENREFADKVHRELAQITSLRDLQVGQSLDYPTVEVNVDRERAGLAGVTTVDVARSLVTATSSSRFVVPNFWADPKSGIGYQVQVEVPRSVVRSPGEIPAIASIEDLEMLPVKNNSGGSVLVRDVATLSEGTMPGQFDRYNMRRQVTLTANVVGADLGSVGREVARALERVDEERPAGVQVQTRGQIVPMRDMLDGLGIGLVLTVVVIFLLLAANFQSLRLALVVVSAVPAVIAGVVLMLYFTGTNLNIQSFIGSIMAVGVAMANAILLVTFAENRRRANNAAIVAAVEGAGSRLRAILMTTCAVIAGMVPMALALGEAGPQNAPLGRAVIGGMLAATITTLFILPSVFAIVQNRAKTTSPSLDPDDPESEHYRAVVSGQ